MDTYVGVGEQATSANAKHQATHANFCTVCDSCQALPPHPAFPCVQLLALDVERLMCQGMFRAAIGLQLLGCTAAPHTPFNSGEALQMQGKVACSNLKAGLLPPRPTPPCLQPPAAAAHL